MTLFPAFKTPIGNNVPFTVTLFLTSKLLSTCKSLFIWPFKALIQEFVDIFPIVTVFPLKLPSPSSNKVPFIDTSD